MRPFSGSDHELHRLLRRCAGGDQQAFARFYQLTATSVLALVQRISPTSDAESMTVRVFVALWSGAALFDPACSDVWVWIVRQTQTVVHDQDHVVARLHTDRCAAGSLLASET